MKKKDVKKPPTKEVPEWAKTWLRAGRAESQDEVIDNEYGIFTVGEGEAPPTDGEESKK